MSSDYTVLMSSTNASCSTFKIENVARSGLVSYEIRNIIEIVLFAAVNVCICLFGIIANIINIIILYKQGLKDTVNIGLFALAIADLGTVVFLELISLSFNPLFENSGILWNRTGVIHLTVSWPHLCFGRISCWITTYITAERCLCIALPMKVKQIITPKRSIIIICATYIINFLTAVPTYIGSYLGWKFFPHKNTSLVTIVFRDNGEELDGISFVLYALSGILSFPPVVILTAILVVRLKLQSQWRMKSSGGNKQNALTSKRDHRTMNMVVIVACILIVCSTPGIISSVVVFLVPSFSITGKDANLFYVVWAFIVTFHAVNSSINIFVYYKMSSRFRQTFCTALERCVKSKKEQAPITILSRT